MVKVEEIYPITTVTYPGGAKISTVQIKHMEQYTAPIELQKFDNFMRGQTMCEDGYYTGDVERWLNGWEVVD